MEQPANVKERLCTMAGRDASELIGMALDRLLQAPAEAPTEAISGLRQRGCPDGSIWWIELGDGACRVKRKDTSLPVATFNDVTESKESEERQILLAREVDHRAKNVLAIVQAVVRIEHDPACTSCVKRVEGRIRALARSHELLVKDGWKGVRLEDLLDDELSVCRDVACHDRWPRRAGGSLNMVSQDGRRSSGSAQAKVEEICCPAAWNGYETVVHTQ